MWRSIMALEGLSICRVLQSRMNGSLAVRSLILAVGTFAMLFVIGPFGMHTSSPIPEHFGWLMLATAWLVVFGIASGIMSLVRSACARAKLDERGA